MIGQLYYEILIW